MSDPITKQNATPDERARYLETLIEAKLGISSAQTALNARRANTNDADETRYIDIQSHELDAEYSKLHAVEIAFLSNHFIFRPPDPATIARIKEIVRQIDGLVANVTRATDVVQAVTGLMNAWRTTLA